MPFLVVGGITLQVVEAGAAESAPVLVGERLRTIDGQDAGMVRREALVRTFTTYDLTPAAWAALRAATPPGVPVACSGDALDGPGDYLVRRRAPHLWDPDAADVIVTATLTLDAVEAL